MQNVTELYPSCRQNVIQRLNRLGGVVGISGGIDSSVYPGLAVQALGAENVLGIMLPEKDSSDDSARFAQELADKFGVKAITENITGALAGIWLLCIDVMKL